MAARLRWAPLGHYAKEIIVVAGGAVAIAVILVALWMRTPASQPALHVEARILKLTLDLSQKWDPVTAVMDVALPDGRRQTFRTPFEPVSRCKVGDPVHLTEQPTLSGGTLISVDPGACR